MSQVTIANTATPQLQSIIKQVQRPRLLLQACGRRVAKDLKVHFRARDKEPNSKGWWKSHWWNREVARNTSFTGATDLEATVTIASKPFVHYLKGGTVNGAPYLAIPINNNAKKKGSPLEWSKKGDGQLIPVTRKRDLKSFLIPGKGKSHGAAYILLKSITHKPHPDALPDTSTIESAIDQEANLYLLRHS